MEHKISVKMKFSVPPSSSMLCIYPQKINENGERIKLVQNKSVQSNKIKILHQVTLEFLAFFSHNLSHRMYAKKPYKYFNGECANYNDNYDMKIGTFADKNNIKDLVNDLQMLGLQDCVYVGGTFFNEGISIESDLSQLFNNPYYLVFDDTKEDALKRNPNFYNKDEVVEECIKYVSNDKIINKFINKKKLTKKRIEYDVVLPDKILKLTKPGVSIFVENLLNFQFIEIDYDKISLALENYLELFETNQLMPQNENFYSYEKLKKNSNEILGDLYESASKDVLINKKIIDGLNNNGKLQLNKIRFFEYLLLLYKRNWIIIKDVDIIDSKITLKITFKMTPSEISKESSSVLQCENFSIVERTGEVFYEGEYICKLKANLKPAKFFCSVAKHYQGGKCVQVKKVYVEIEKISGKKYDSIIMNKSQSEENAETIKEYVKNRFDDLRKFFRQKNVKFPFGMRITTFKPKHKKKNENKHEIKPKYENIKEITITIK